MNDNFCLAPWFSLYIGARYIKPCCLWIGDDSNKWETIEDIRKIWDSQKMQDVRKSFLNGIVPSECSNCLRRISSRKIWLDDRIKNNIDSRRFTLNPSLKPLQVDFQLGSKCNLQCRSCGSWGSSNWTEDDMYFQELDPEFVRQIVPEFNLDVSQFKDHKDIFTDLVRFDFKGGEPMIHNSMIEMIDNLVKWEIAPNITLAYVTNGSFINKKITDLWSNFKQIRIIISIDGTEDLFSYIRGYDFEILEKNLGIYDQIKNLKGSYNMTVSMYNILDLAEINHWIMTRDFEKFPCTNNGKNQTFDCNVTNPPYLDVTILPRKYKRLALDRIYKYDHPNIIQLANWLKTIQDIPANRKQLKLFVLFTKMLDNMRGTNFLELRPEFEDIFKEYL